MEQSGVCSRRGKRSTAKPAERTDPWVGYLYRIVRTYHRSIPVCVACGCAKEIHYCCLRCLGQGTRHCRWSICSTTCNGIYSGRNEWQYHAECPGKLCHERRSKLLSVCRKGQPEIL